MVVGDSEIEIDASYYLAEYDKDSLIVYSQFKESCLKTVKLKEKPDMIELLKQMELVNSKFDEICSRAKNLNIRLLKL